MPAENEILSSWEIAMPAKLKSSMMQWTVTSFFPGIVLFCVHAHQAKQSRAGAGQGVGGRADGRGGGQGAGQGAW